MASTRERALDAAVELLGTEGLRALTHGRVDERAGIPRGSTSNWFRTRAALLAGVADWIVQQELRGVDVITTPPASVEEFVDGLSAGIEHLTGRNRTTTAARLVLFLEANSDPVLRESLTRGRAVIEPRMIGTLARLGARDPATGAAAVMACAEGIILHRIARGDTSDPRPALAAAVRGALT